MRKIVILFGSPRRSTNEYESIWMRSPCEGRKNVQGQYTILKGTNWEIHVFNGLNSKYYEESWKFDILKEKINEIAKNCSKNCEMSIFLHGTKEERDQLKKALGSDFPWPVISYTHMTGTFYNDCIKPFASQCGGQEFCNLWKTVELEKKEERRRRAEDFRYRILTPFVAIDLLKEAGKTDVPDNIMQAINNINGEDLFGQLYGEFEITRDENLENDIARLIKHHSTLKSDEFHQILDGIAKKLEAEMVKFEK